MITALQSGSAPGSKVGTQAIIDAVASALRVSIRPLDHSDASGNLLGHYRANLITGTTVSLLANAPIVSMRWAVSNAVAVLMRITASAQVAAAITAGTLVDLEAVIARSFTAADTAGTLSLPGTGKNRASMGISLVNDLRVATTTTLTAGTRTLDPLGFGFATWAQFVAPTIGATANTGVAIGAGDSTPRELYKWDAFGQHPIILGNNEGLILRNSSAGPVTGGIRYAITLEWAEVAVF